MGIKERRERERQLTREAILRAALTIAKRDGWAGLTIRKVGEEIEYSPPMVYEYFSNKEDMLVHLARQGFEQLKAALQQAATSASDSEERLYKVAFAYWEFGVAHPELYQLMHGSSDLPLNNALILNAIHEVSAEAEQTLLVWADEHGLAISDSFGATELLWCLLHGFVTLHLLKRVAGDEARARMLLEHVLRNQLFAWKSHRRVV
jgi:AcrR family transcriptional regulator